MQNGRHLSSLYESGIDFLTKTHNANGNYLQDFQNCWSSFLGYHTRAKCVSANRVEENNRLFTEMEHCR